MLHLPHMLEILKIVPSNNDTQIETLLYHDYYYCETIQSMLCRKHEPLKSNIFVVTHFIAFN